MKDDFRGLLSGSFCFIEDANEDEDEDEGSDGEVRN
jgi:hypothetical protein